MLTFGIMDAIRLPDLLRILYECSSDGEFVPNEITFVTNDRKKGTGGKKITIKQAIPVGGPKSSSELRNPNHYRNYTRNIRSVDSDKIIKIHPLLITRFNGQPIML